MGQALRGSAGDGGSGRGAAAHRGLIARLVMVLAALAPATLVAQELAPLRIDRGRFTVVCFPPDSLLASTLVADAERRDTFPGLPRPKTHVLLAIAPDKQRFRDWVGPSAPEWGAAIAFPDERRIVMQGRAAGSDAGNPESVLRHELAHLALHEYLGDAPPRWFDEGYAGFAAGEWGKQEVLATNVALIWRGIPPLDSLDAGFEHGASRADASYALAYLAVSDLDAHDPSRGLALFLRYWKDTGSMEQAMRNAYGITGSAFDDEWRTRTRRRYGALALFADISLASLVFLLMLTPLYVAKRRRDRARLTAMRRAEEAADRAARASALAALLGEEWDQ